MDNVINSIQLENMFKSNKEGLNNETINFISKIQYDKFEKILDLLFQQKMLSSHIEYYSIYAIDIDSKDYKIEYLKDNTQIVKDNNYCYPCIYLTDKYLLFRMISIEDLTFYLNIYKNNRKYVYIPILLSSNENNQLAHQTILTFNLDNNKAYLIDPNGQSNYLDKYSKSDIKIEPLINILIKEYLKETNIEFISSRIWNQDDIWINKTSYNLCVPTSLLLIQYMHETKLEPNEIIKKFKDIVMEDLFKLICNYTNNLYDKINNI